VGGLHAHVRQGDDRTGHQQSIAKIEQCGASMEALVAVGAKRAERCQGMSAHAAQLVRVTGRWPA
jgi:hypothetical protein